MSMEFSLDTLIQALAGQSGRGTQALFDTVDKRVRDTWAELEVLLARAGHLTTQLETNYKAYRVLGGSPNQKIDDFLGGRSAFPRSTNGTQPLGNPAQPPVAPVPTVSEAGTVVITAPVVEPAKPRIVETAYGPEVVNPQPARLTKRGTPLRYPTKSHNTRKKDFEPEDVVAFLEKVKRELGDYPSIRQMCDHFNASYNSIWRRLITAREAGVLPDDYKDSAATRKGHTGRGRKAFDRRFWETYVSGNHTVQ